MKLCSALVATAICVSAASAADAKIVDVTGTLQDLGSFTAKLDLDLQGNKVISGTGTFSFSGVSNTPVSLITTMTPGNEDNSKDFPGAPVGFRANDGTDYYALDEAYPFSTNGLLFAIGTSAPTPGANPLLALYSNGNGTFGAQFTGNIDGTEYYNKSGSFTFSEQAAGAVPEPATWAMMIVGFGLVGSQLRRRKSTVRVRYA